MVLEEEKKVRSFQPRTHHVSSGMSTGKKNEKDERKEKAVIRIIVMFREGTAPRVNDKDSKERSNTEDTGTLP